MIRLLSLLAEIKVERPGSRLIAKYKSSHGGVRNEGLWDDYNININGVYIEGTIFHNIKNEMQLNMRDDKQVNLVSSYLDKLHIPHTKDINICVPLKYFQIEK